MLAQKNVNVATANVSSSLAPHRAACAADPKESSGGNAVSVRLGVNIGAIRASNAQYAIRGVAG